MDFDLLDLDSAPVELSDEKYTITVEYDNKETQVSWYKGLETKDIEEAILSACDSIIDSGFSLTDSSGFPVSFGQIVPGERYLIIPGSEIKGKEKIIGDRVRRLTVEVSPLQHIEASRAVEIMKTGSNLLKHTRSSMPHIRLFQITDDLKVLMWYSSGKAQDKSMILFSNVYDLKIGQTTDSFQDYPIPALEHLSFSLIHSKGTLDLTCRDEREFDFWVIGCKALIFHNKGLKVSKQVLMSHSRRFMEFLRQAKFSQAVSSIYSEAESKKLEECIVRKALSREEVSQKLHKVHNKLGKVAERILDLPSDIAGYDLGKESTDAFGGEYDELDLDEGGTEEIYHSEQHRLKVLNESSRKKLFELETEFANRGAEPEDKDTTAFEIELWRLEVDVENLCDIVSRIEKVSDEKWGKKIKSWFKDLF